MEIKEYQGYNEKEILNLYRSVGWTAYTDEPISLKAGFQKSLLILGAYEKDRLLGIIRAVGDASTILYIQDVLVRPEAQRKGIGTALVRAAVSHFQSVRQIVLATDDTPKTNAFYRSLGFAPMAENGCCGFMKDSSAV